MSKHKQNKVRIYESQFVNWVIIVTDQYNQVLLDSAGHFTEKDAVKYYKRWKHEQ